MAFSDSGKRSSGVRDPLLLAETPAEIILVKPPGMPAQRDETGDMDLLTWAERTYQRPFHLVHRIDRPVGGIMLLAKDRRSAARWSARFREGQVRKAYLAITAPPVYPPFGELRHYIQKDARRHRARIFHRPVEGADLAILRYQTIAVTENLSLVLVEPQTGRFHQIRVQLAGLRSPIIGDVKYGYPPPAPDPRSIALWAWRLEGWQSLPPLDVFPWKLFSNALQRLAQRQ